MGACLSFICGAQDNDKESGSTTEALLGRERLKIYLTDTIARLDKSTPSSSELKEKIMPSVVGSIKRLSAGAPKQVREGLQKTLMDHMVLSYMASQSQFREALVECRNLVSNGPAPVPAPVPAKPNFPEPTEQELQTLNGVLGRLWKIDEGRRLDPETDYVLGPALRPLFKKVNWKKVNANPVMKAFMSLLDNYKPGTDEAELFTTEQKMEMDSFMRLLMQTPQMQYAYRVLQKWKPKFWELSANYSEFEALVFKIWFTNYGIGRGPASTSGFEHTFVGEVDANKDAVVGLHNWIQMSLLEKQGQLEYQRFFGKCDQDQRCVSLSFSWQDEEKDVSTFLVGTSVAFEFAMYTIAFLGYDGKCDQSGVYLGNRTGPIRICTYPWNTCMGDCVRSAFIRRE